jgi:hypothetical protein
MEVGSTMSRKVGMSCESDFVPVARRPETVARQAEAEASEGFGPSLTVESPPGCGIIRR